MIPYLPKRRSAKLINIPRKLCLIQQEYAGIVSVPHNENNSLTVFPKNAESLRASSVGRNELVRIAEVSSREKACP